MELNILTKMIRQLQRIAKETINKIKPTDQSGIFMKENKNEQRFL